MSLPFSPHGAAQLVFRSFKFSNSAPHAFPDCRSYLLQYMDEPLGALQVTHVSHVQAGWAAQDQFHDFSDTANFPEMISLRLGEHMRQRLASLDTRANSLLDGGQRAPGPVFRLNEVENFTILRKAGDEPRHDAA
jgi:hypothetical protein